MLSIVLARACKGSDSDSEIAPRLEANYAWLSKTIPTTPIKLMVA
jgi:hypothetical protein